MLIKLTWIIDKINIKNPKPFLTNIKYIVEMSHKLSR